MDAQMDKRGVRDRGLGVHAGKHSTLTGRRQPCRRGYPQEKSAPPFFYSGRVQTDTRSSRLMIACLTDPSITGVNVARILALSNRL